jgi:CRP-like cAMP-binding protein
MNPEILRQYLPQIRSIRLFYYLSDQELKSLLAVSEIVRYRTGEKIISQGEPSEHLFAVLEGSATVSVSDSGNEFFICSIQKGQVFGEAAIFMTERRTANVRTSEDTTVIRIHKADMLSFIKHHSQGGIKVLMIILKGLLKKLRNTNIDFIVEKKSDVQSDDIDPMIQDIMNNL